MDTKIDRENIEKAYLDVRNDDSETAWAYLEYDDTNIIVESTGADYEEFLAKIDDEKRAFGYVRVYTGDEMSRRAKFAFITWIGPDVPPLKRAKVSTDKSLVQTVVQNFAKEIQTSEKPELDFQFLKDELTKAGGANYGTGQTA